MSVWDNEANLLALKDLHDKGLSASQIAKELGQGISRNAVIGKIHRSGMVRPAAALPLMRGKQIAHTRPKRFLVPPAPKVRKPHVNPPKPVAEPESYHPPRVVIKANAWEPLPGSDPQPECKHGFCKWPVGTWDEGDRAFCANPAKWHKDGYALSYCTDHHAMSVDPVQPKYKRDRLMRGALWAAERAA